MPLNKSLLVTPEQKQAEVIENVISTFKAAIQVHIDGKAQERRYDSGATLASYINSTVETWSKEAHAFIAWRDDVWVYALAQLDEVKSGSRAAPDVSAFLEEMPSLIWPD